MSGAPFARRKLIPEGNPNNKRHQPYRDASAKLFILHSQVGGTSLHDYFGRESVVVESHYQVWKNGIVDLLVDTDLTADANYKANPRAISAETEDNGNPDRDRWTYEQCKTLAMLIVYHDIPLRMATGPYDDGIGYHSQFDEWTAAPGIGKTCPGKARIKQIPYIIELAQKIKDGVMSWAEKIIDTPDKTTKVAPSTAIEILWRAAAAQNDNDKKQNDALARIENALKTIGSPTVELTQEQINIAVAKVFEGASITLNLG